MPQNESKELLEALDAMKNEKNKENAERLTKLLEDVEVLVPAVMPKNTDPAILKQMSSTSPDTPQPIPEGAQPLPCCRMKLARSFFLYLHLMNRLKRERVYQNIQLPLICHLSHALTL